MYSLLELPSTLPVFFLLLLLCSNTIECVNISIANKAEREEEEEEKTALFYFKLTLCRFEMRGVFLSPLIVYDACKPTWVSPFHERFFPFEKAIANAHIGSSLCSVFFSPPSVVVAVRETRGSARPR